jgi:hypothetical protein
MYSWGYRFDLETKRIVKIGGLYFKALPKSVYISVVPAGSKENGITKKTDMFFGSALVENLLPKTYDIEITKDGFYPWKKNLEVKENQVTEAKNVVLIPKDPDITLLNKNTSDFFVSPDGKFAILKEKSTSSAFTLKTLDLTKNVKSHLMDAKDLSKNTDLALLDLIFSQDSQKILLKVSDKGILKYFLLDLKTTPVKPQELTFLDKNVGQISFNPLDSQKMFVTEKGVLYEGDLTQKKLSTSTLAQTVRSFALSGQDFYYLDASGFVFKTNLSFPSQKKMNDTPLPLEAGKTYKIYPFGDRILLADGKSLFLLNQDSGSFETFFETENEPKLSPDSKKAVYWSDSEIWLVFLRQEAGQPPKQEGQRVFISRFSEKIGDVFWCNPAYLIFNVGKKIKIAEIDDRDVINIIDLVEYNSPKLFWDENLKKLFILSEGSFYGSKQLLP